MALEQQVLVLTKELKSQKVSTDLSLESPAPRESLGLQLCTQLCMIYQPSWLRLSMVVKNDQLWKIGNALLISQEHFKLGDKRPSRGGLLETHFNSCLMNPSWKYMGELDHHPKRQDLQEESGCRALGGVTDGGEES